ncbi:MAG: hypothetical protein HYR73_09955, partial [Candidatus Eisenbacteria bacterium]|nr:hypothetical protein [Candidatus Eisenbacteria bacterium]
MRRFRPLPSARPLLAAACLCAASLAVAAPPPELRSRPGVRIDATRPLIARVPDGMPPRPGSGRLYERRDVPAADRNPGRACATRLEGVLDAISRHAGRALAQPLPTAYSIDTAGIAVMEDDGTFFYNSPGPRAALDVAALAQAFYRTHGDDYDALAIYLSSGLSDYLGSATALAAAYIVKNEVAGIGLDAFDLSAGLGTPPRLGALLSMNGLQHYPADPDSVIGGPTDTFTAMDVLAHEFGHRWLAYVWVDSAGQPVPALLGRDFSHWNFFADVDSSVMEGCDWANPAPDSFVTDGVSNGYGRLDQYLMGLRAESEIDSFFVINDASSFDPPGTYVPWSIPYVGIGCRGRATWWRVSDIEAVNGPRVPDAASSPHTFRLATVLVTPHGSP